MKKRAWTLLALQWMLAADAVKGDVVPDHLVPLIPMTTMRSSMQRVYAREFKRRRGGGWGEGGGGGGAGRGGGGGGAGGGRGGGLGGGGGGKPSTINWKMLQFAETSLTVVSFEICLKLVSATGLKAYFLSFVLVVYTFF